MIVAGQISRLSSAKTFRTAYEALRYETDDEGHRINGYRKLELCAMSCCVCGCACCTWFFLGFMVLNIFTTLLLSDYGTQIMGADTNFEKVQLNPFTGWGQVDGVTIDHPNEANDIKGKFADIRYISAKMDMISLLGTIHIEHMRISHMFLQVIKPLHHDKSNVDYIVEHLHKYIADPKAEEVFSMMLSKRMIVDEIHLINVTAYIDMPFLTEKEPPTKYRIPEIIVTDVGRRQGGVVLFKVITVVIQRVLAGVLEALPGQIGGNLVFNSVNTALAVVDDEELWGSAQVNLGKGLASMRVAVDVAADKLGDGLEKAGEKMSQGMMNFSLSMGGKPEKAKKLHERVSNFTHNFSTAIKTAAEKVTDGVKNFESETKEFMDDAQEGVHDFTKDFQDLTKKHEQAAGFSYDVDPGE